MAKSADKIFAQQSNIVFHVFTDQVELCNLSTKDFRNIQIKIHQIDNLVWPAATIDRYKIFFESRDVLIEDFLVHMDADMIIHKDFLLELENFQLNQDVTFVAHPGYWRQPLTSRSFHSLARQLRDLFLKTRVGALGAWENRPNSTAFVTRSAREKYVCGGVWMGKRSAFIDLCKTLYANVEIDASRNIIAKWHDESHLNKWASINDFNLLPPSFCFSTAYPHLNSLENIIEAVTKEQKYSDSKRTN